jgi:hypothetical protein
MRRFGSVVLGMADNVFEDSMEALPSMSASAHLIQMLDSSIKRAYVSAAGVKRVRNTGARAAASRWKSAIRLWEIG